jgi:clan AA aspartic protease (TIGR02281 family)
VKLQITTLIAGGLLALTLFGVAVAGQFEDGDAAYQRGDYATAMQLLRRALLADQGNVLHCRDDWCRNVLAEYNLGVMYAKGQGVPQDYAQAATWFRKAADQGNALAQANLGMAYDKGQGVPQDYAQAVAWYRKAADQGEAEAQLNLGAMYEYGQGVPQDYAQAATWLRKAADQGEDEAIFFLGMMCSLKQGARTVCEERPREHLDRPEPLAEEASAQTQSYKTETESSKYASEIHLQKQGGTFVIPVSINNALTLNFIIDTGAADVSIQADVVLTLMRTGTLLSEDFLGSQTYTLADGSTAPSDTFRIRTLKVGDREIENVTGSVAKVEGSLLLGQSFLTRFRSWSIDNERGVLLLN